MSNNGDNENFDGPGQASPPQNPQPAGAAGAAVQLVSVKPPQFSPNFVKKWFTLLETQFVDARITADATKCTYVFSNIPMDVFDKVPDEVINAKNYTNLKNYIINLYSKPIPQQYSELIQCNVLATKPSIYLQQLRSHASNWNLPDDFLKVQFINAMPSAIKPNLIAHQGTLNEIADFADMLMSYNYQNVPQNFQMFNANVPTQSACHVSRQTSTGQQNRNYPQSNNYSQSNNTVDFSNNAIPHNVRAFNSKQKPLICRYHLYYGQDAKRCKSYCFLNNPSVKTLPDSRPQSPAPRNRSEN